jgi:hypothetical protein
MMPIAVVSPVAPDPSRCWLPAGHDDVRLERASTRPHEPRCVNRAGSISRLRIRIADIRRDRRITRRLDGRPEHRRRRRNPHSGR